MVVQDFNLLLLACY